MAKGKTVKFRRTKDILKEIIDPLPTKISAPASKGAVDLQAVSALPAEEQLLLQFISIVYEPVSVSFLARCLATLDPAFLGNRRIGSDEISEMVARFRRKGFLNGKNQCPPALAEFLTRQTLSQNRFSPADCPG